MIVLSNDYSKLVVNTSCFNNFFSRSQQLKNIANIYHGKRMAQFLFNFQLELIIQLIWSLIYNVTHLVCFSWWGNDHEGLYIALVGRVTGGRLWLGSEVRGAYLLDPTNLLIGEGLNTKDQSWKHHRLIILLF